MDTVITFVLEGIKTFVTNVFTAIALMLEQLFPLVEVQSTSPLKISVDGNPIVFSMDVVGRGLAITFGDMVFVIQNVLKTKPKSLGIDEYTFFYALFVNSELPADRYWLIKEGVTGLRIGMLLGVIEGKLLLNELDVKEAMDTYVETMIGGITGFPIMEPLDLIQHVKRNTKSIPVEIGLKTLVGLSMVANLMLASYWLNQISNYL